MTTDLMNHDMARLAAWREARRKASDRRRRPRTSARGRIEVSVEVDGRTESVTGILRDLSRGGVGVLLPVAVTPGHCLHFRAMIGPKILSATCRVANCRPDPAGGYIVGAEMVAAERLTECAAASPEDVDQSHLAEVRNRLGAVEDRTEAKAASPS